MDAVRAAFDIINKCRRLPAIVETFPCKCFFFKTPPPGRILNGRDIRGCATALLLDQSRGGTLYGAIRGIRVLELSWIWTLLK